MSSKQHTPVPTLPQKTKKKKNPQHQQKKGRDLYRLTYIRAQSNLLGLAENKLLSGKINAAENKC